MLNVESTRKKICQRFYRHLNHQSGYQGSELTQEQLDGVFSSLQQTLAILNDKFHRGQVAQTQVEAQNAHLIRFTPSLCPSEATYELICDFISWGILPEEQGRSVIDLLKLMVSAGCFANHSPDGPDDQQAEPASPASHPAQGASRD